MPPHRQPPALQPQTYVGAQALRAFVGEVVQAHGLPFADAETVAEGLVLANLRGVDSHGVARLPMYCERLRQGVLEPKPKIVVKNVSPAALSVDGGNGLGFVVGGRAMAEAISLAQTQGLALAGVRHSNHFGMSAYYVLQALDAGMISLAFTNSSPALPVWGGREKFLGASPFAAGAPGGARGPLVLDMACTVTARGKLKYAAQRGEPIPPGLALDRDGRPTTDGNAAFEGVVLPFAGAKGAGLSMLMEVLCGVLTGAGFGGQVENPYTGLAGPQDVGHFFMAIRPDLFLDGADYEARMDALVERAKAQPLAEGIDEILMTGEPESRTQEIREQSGIPLTADVVHSLKREADALGLALPELAPEPPAGS
jgi:LDH2 family malate/lactate/ureidoglycolate dehydrogenase